MTKFSSVNAIIYTAIVKIYFSQKKFLSKKLDKLEEGSTKLEVLDSNFVNSSNFGLPSPSFLNFLLWKCVITIAMIKFARIFKKK